VPRPAKRKRNGAPKVVAGSGDHGQRRGSPRHRTSGRPELNMTSARAAARRACLRVSGGPREGRAVARLLQVEGFGAGGDFKSGRPPPARCAERLSLAAKGIESAHRCAVYSNAPFEGCHRCRTRAGAFQRRTEARLPTCDALVACHRIPSARRVKHGEKQFFDWL
jgi:hypothetical protein